MRQISFAFVMALVSACSGQHANEMLRDELLEMGRVDQAVRFRILDMLNEADLEALNNDEFRALADEQAAVDEANFLRLEEIYQQHGWPGVELVGEDANGAAWLILQHANIERKRRYLGILREEVANDAALASNLAMLEDEVALVDGGRQLYGTEITMENGVLFVAPVVDPANLDERRATVGLPPMEEYLRRAEAEIGQPIDRQGLVFD